MHSALVLVLDVASCLILNANQDCEAALDVPSGKLVGRSILPWIEESMRRVFGTVVRRVGATGLPQSFEAAWREGNTRKPFRVIVRPLPNGQVEVELKAFSHSPNFKQLAS